MVRPAEPLRGALVVACLGVSLGCGGNPASTQLPEAPAGSTSEPAAQASSTAGPSAPAAASATPSFIAGPCPTVEPRGSHPPDLRPAEARRLAADPSCHLIELDRRPWGHLLYAVTEGGHNGIPKLESYAPSSPRSGDSYVLLDESGYLGMIEATDQTMVVACKDHCPRARVRARWVDPPNRETYVAVAIGPATASYPKARLQRCKGKACELTSGSDDWKLQQSIDLDDDGQADIQTRHRPCGCHYIAVETRVRFDCGWRVTERYLDVPLPTLLDWCAAAPR